VSQRTTGGDANLFRDMTFFYQKETQVIDLPRTQRSAQAQIRRISFQAARKLISAVIPILV
jgi:hypothetical protein